MGRFQVVGATVVDGSGATSPSRSRTGASPGWSVRPVEDGGQRGRAAATKTNAEAGVLAPGKQADLALGNGNQLGEPAVFADPANAVPVVQTGRVVKDLR